MYFVTIGIYTLFSFISFASANTCPSCTENSHTCESSRETSSKDLNVEVPWKLNNYNGYAVEEAITKQLSKQANLELQAAYTYLSMALYFDRDYVAMLGFSKMFKEDAEEEMKHAFKIMTYMNSRGIHATFAPIDSPCDNPLLVLETKHQPSNHCETIQGKIYRKPDPNVAKLMNCDWKDPLSAVSVARQLEINVYRNLKLIHAEADKRRDPNVKFSNGTAVFG